jgi:hypothetical protein
MDLSDQAGKIREEMISVLFTPVPLVFPAYPENTAKKPHATDHYATTVRQALDVVSGTDVK